VLPRSFGAVVLQRAAPLDNLLRDAGIRSARHLWPRFDLSSVWGVARATFHPADRRPVTRHNGSFSVLCWFLFFPCAGPRVSATIAVVALARVGFSAVILTLAYGVGVAVPLLLLTSLAMRSRGEHARCNVVR